uniref:Proteasome activator complex subunit 4 C-terminal domain-containing protein n=1 Tax=Hanusia phi TaxID=3032 RepID=A0A7S0F2D7_9CRYP
MLEALVALLDGKTKTHWRYRLMIVHTISTLLRDDVAPPVILWNVVLDELVSDVSHVRKVCLRAFNTMLQQLQTEQQSKVEFVEEHDRFPDKNFSNWNGMPSRKRINEHLTQVRQKVITEHYKLEVVEMLRNRFKTSLYVENIIKCLSVIQAARAKSFVGSFAQMWKGLFKVVGLDVLHAMEPFLDGVIGDPQAYTKLSTDVYLGQQCLAAEIVGGLIRGCKYWSATAKEIAQDKICKMLEVVLNLPEMESASTWSSCLRFSVFDRHPRRVGWLISFLFDSALPSCSNESSRNSVLFCRRLAILRPILNELSWRGVPLHRQLIHDLEPYLESPYSQTREAASSCVGLITRVTWNPPWRSASAGGDQEAAGNNGHDPDNSCHPTATRPPCPMQFTTSEPLWPSECIHGLIARVCSKICRKGMAARLQQLRRKSLDENKVDQNFDDLLTELKNLRHALIRLVSAVCPHFEGMYSCPLAPHLPAVLPPLLQALEDRDKDISRQAKHCAELAANTPMLCRNILPQLLSSVYSVGKSTSWHVRAAMLPFLQIVTFRHQFLISEEDLWSIRGLMVFLLQDSQVEVRETACTAISVLVRMSGEETALELKQSFYLWADSSIPSASKATKSESSSTFSDALLKRHAGVLGLAALVGAYPYDVPEWMPEVLVRLATHVLDPMPIRQTVRKIFGEFWRTHQDSWPVLKSKFDEQQLSTLTNLLVAPTYFS